MLEATTGEDLITPTIAETMNGYLSSRQSLGRSGSTCTRYTPIIAGFLASLGDKRSAATVASLSAREIGDWRDEQVSAGKAPKTVNLQLSIVRAALTAAKRRGEILSNPAEAVEMVAGVGDERSPFKSGEVAALLQAADSEWKTAILLGALAGLRLADAASVTWKQVDLDSGILSVTPEKTERPIQLSLASELLAHISTLPRGIGAAPLIPSLSGRATGSNGARGGLSNEFRRLMARAGIVAALGKKKSGKGRQVSSKSFHSLRHTFVSNLVAEGVPDRVVMGMTGHSTEEAYRRYVHLGLDAQRAALSKLRQLAASSK
jgi:integrase